MGYERSEDYWYGRGWPELRRELVKLCLWHADALLETLVDSAGGGREIEAACRTWFDAVSCAIDAMLRARPETERWRHAMSLLIVPQDLAAVLTNDRVLRNGGNEGNRVKALRVCLKSHLETQRQEASPGSPHRRRVWERLYRISRSMLPLEAEPGYHCGKEHHQAVLEEIKRHHAGDHNLPRRIDMVSSYFYEFCRECSGNLPDDEVLSEDDLALLAEVTEEALDRERARRWLQELPAELAESYAVVHKLQELLPGSEHFLSVEAYAVRRSLSKRQIYKREREAQKRLEARLDSQFKDDMVEP